MAASASITHEALKTKARVYSVRQTPAGPLFLLWVPLSLRVQPPAPLVSRVARQRQRGSLSDTRSRRADADGILKTGFFWAALVPGLVPSPRVAGALRTCLIRIGPSGLVLGRQPSEAWPEGGPSSRPRVPQRGRSPPGTGGVVCDPQHPWDLQKSPSPFALGRNAMGAALVAVNFLIAIFKKMRRQIESVVIPYFI